MLWLMWLVLLQELRPPRLTFCMSMHGCMERLTSLPQMASLHSSEQHARVTLDT